MRGFIACRNVYQQTLRFCTANAKHKTAGMIVIGDEILKGEVADTNSTFSCKVLHDLGVKLKKISVVGDNINAVSEEVAEFSQLYDYVITTGGIGPTHDDITFEGVAKAFDEPLVMNKDIQDICDKYNHRFSKIKLSKIPQSAQLRYYPELKFPRIAIKNVFLFPGVPQLFEKAFSVVAKDSFSGNGPFYTKAVYLNVTEEEILTQLNLIVKLCPNVEFGSYPNMYNDNYKVKITIESSDERATDEAYSRLLKLIPAEMIV
ncbi:hypothetical protein WA026_007045 [Henosepilachna vigintioctopunctata]